MIRRDARANQQSLDKLRNSIGTLNGSSGPAIVPAQTIENHPEFPSKRPDGTNNAIISKILSGAPPSKRSWGGARNSTARTSESLSLEQAANIIAAALHAVAIGLPFNRHLTIHWEQAGIPDRRAAWATGRFLKLASDWIARQGGSVAWAWVRENGEHKGSHVHILMHVPDGLSLGRMQRRWIRRIAGMKGQEWRGVPKTRRIGGSSSAARTNFPGYLANLLNVVGYLLKGIDPTAGELLGLDRLEAGGRITGKRAATSQNVGRKARRAG